MNKNFYWTGHILSGSPELFTRYQRDVGAVAVKRAKGKKAPLKAAAFAAAAPPAAAPFSTPNQLKAAAIWFCALTVTKIHYTIDSNDPDGSLAEPTDWSNAAGEQAAVLAITINQEAPAIAAHEAPSYDLTWTAISASDLASCSDVSAVLDLIRGHYA